MEGPLGHRTRRCSDRKEKRSIWGTRGGSKGQKISEENWDEGDVVGEAATGQKTNGKRSSAGGLDFH